MWRTKRERTKDDEKDGREGKDIIANAQWDLDQMFDFLQVCSRLAEPVQSGLMIIRN